MTKFRLPQCYSEDFKIPIFTSCLNNAVKQKQKIDNLHYRESFIQAKKSQKEDRKIYLVKLQNLVVECCKVYMRNACRLATLVYFVYDCIARVNCYHFLIENNIDMFSF